MKRITIVGTADIKGEELACFRNAAIEAGGLPPVVDAGMRALSGPMAPQRLIRRPHPINDPPFSAALAENFRVVAGQGEAMCR